MTDHDNSNTRDRAVIKRFMARPLFVWREENRWSVKRTRCGHRMRADNFLNTGHVVVECHWCGATWLHGGGDGL